MRQSVEVHRFEMVIIWLGRRVERARSSRGNNGVRGGQFGLDEVEVEGLIGDA